MSHRINTIICTFNQQDISIKSCNVTYGQCGQQQSQSAYNVGSETQLTLDDLELSDGVNYCYTVTASNNTVTVFIEGSIMGEYKNSISCSVIFIDLFLIYIYAYNACSGQSTGFNLGSGAVAGIILAAVVMFLAATVIIIILLLLWYMHKKGECA